MKHLGSAITILVLFAFFLASVGQVPAQASGPVMVPAGMTETPEPPTLTPTPAATDTPTQTPTLEATATATATVDVVVESNAWNILINKPEGVTWWVWIPWLETP